MIGDPTDYNSNAASAVGEVNLNPSNNTTEAPTNANTRANILPKVSEIDLDFITLIDQHWSLTGEIPTAEKAHDLWGFSLNEFTSLLSKASVIMALEERGINLSRIVTLDSDDSPQWRKSSLTPTQLIVANALLDLTDQRSDKKKLQDLGVTTGQYQRWLKDPVFNSYLRERAEGLLGDSQHEASLALLDKVKAGDLAALKFYMEYTGRFLSSTDKGQSNGTAINQDFTALMVRIIEIITEEADGPTAFRIAQRLKEATAIHKMAIDISAAEIVVPDVAPMRILTSEMKQLAGNTGGEGLTDA